MSDKKKPKYKFRVLGGTHVGRGRFNQNQVFHKGDIVETDDPLHKLFKYKFRLLGGGEETEENEEPQGIPDVAPAEKAEEIDVTEEYPDAVLVGFQVVKKKSKYHVYDGANAITPADGVGGRSIKKFIKETVADMDIEE